MEDILQCLMVLTAANAAPITWSGVYRKHETLSTTKPFHDAIHHRILPKQSIRFLEAYGPTTVQ